MRSVLFNVEDKMGFRKRKQEMIAKVWKQGKNVVVGSEFLDYAAAMTLEEAKPAFERLFGLFPDVVIPETDMSVAVMYRTPRSTHLVSAWKQQMAMAKRSPPKTNLPWRVALETKFKSKPPSLAEWLCTGQWEGRVEFDVETIIAAQINAMGVADAFIRHGNMTATMGDMSDMDDVPSTVVCEVLKIPCTEDGKVKKRESKVLNQRSNPTELGMNDAEMVKVEEIIRRMDCFYYCNGLKDSLTVLRAKDEMFTNSAGWNNCCESPASFLDPSAAYRELKSLGCKASDLKDVPQVKSSLLQGGKDVKQTVTPPTKSPGLNDVPQTKSSFIEVENDQTKSSLLEAEKDVKQSATPQTNTNSPRGRNTPRGRKNDDEVGLLDRDKILKEIAVGDDIAKQSSLTDGGDITTDAQPYCLLFPGYLATIAFLIVSAGFIRFRKRRSKDDKLPV
jgi:uncharacterized protein (DUF2164 family)